MSTTYKLVLNCPSKTHKYEYDVEKTGWYNGIKAWVLDLLIEESSGVSIHTCETVLKIVDQHLRVEYVHWRESNKSEIILERTKNAK